jgi:hypothetical protein
MLYLFRKVSVFLLSYSWLPCTSCWFTQSHYFSHLLQPLKGKCSLLYFLKFQWFTWSWLSLCQYNFNHAQLSCPEDGGNRFLWNVGRNLLDCTITFQKTVQIIFIVTAMKTSGFVNHVMGTLSSTSHTSEPGDIIFLKSTCQLYLGVITFNKCTLHSRNSLKGCTAKTLC